jgi:hypothetical protein
MHHALGVGRVEGHGDLPEERQHLVGRHPSTGPEASAQGLPVEKLHGQEVGARPVERWKDRRLSEG